MYDKIRQYKSFKGEVDFTFKQELQEDMTSLEVDTYIVGDLLGTIAQLLNFELELDEDDDISIAESHASNLITMFVQVLQKHGGARICTETGAVSVYGSSTREDHNFVEIFTSKEDKCQ